jgi:hypothetical protein
VNAIQKFDEVWTAMLAEGGVLKRDSNKVCDACGKPNRSVLVSPSGLCVCADCHDLPTLEGRFGIATRHPQGDLLTRMPLNEKFTKKFP